MTRLAALLALVCALPLAAEPLTYPRHSSGADPETYVVELLRQPLARSGGDYQLRPSPGRCRRATPSNRWCRTTAACS